MFKLSSSLACKHNVMHFADFLPLTIWSSVVVWRLTTHTRNTKRHNISPAPTCMLPKLYECRANGQLCEKCEKADIEVHCNNYGKKDVLNKKKNSVWTYKCIIIKDNHYVCICYLLGESSARYWYSRSVRQASLATMRQLVSLLCYSSSTECNAESPPTHIVYMRIRAITSFRATQIQHVNAFVQANRPPLLPHKRAFSYRHL